MLSGNGLWLPSSWVAPLFLFSIVVGLPLGILSAVRRGGIIDNFSKIIALIGQSAPNFWLGFMLIVIFAIRLEWVPPSGRQDWNSIILPAVTLGWFFVAANMRLVRSAMLDVLDSEFIKLARAKGVPGYALIWKHAFRNAIIPPLTFAGVTLGNLVAGSITTELVFAWPGLGFAGHQRYSRFRLPGPSGGGNHLHPAIRWGRPVGGRVVRLYRPPNQVRLGGRVLKWAADLTLRTTTANPLGRVISAYRAARRFPIIPIIPAGGRGCLWHLRQPPGSPRTPSTAISGLALCRQSGVRQGLRRNWWWRCRRAVNSFTKSR